MIWVPRRVRAANIILGRFNLQVQERRPTAWDRSFQRWIKQAKGHGGDPNDLGDDAWDGDRLEEGLRNHYLPLLTEDSRVLELGPGSGRVTRRLIESCAHLTLVDASPVVCAWLREYLQGKGSSTVLQIDGKSLAPVPSQSIDVAIAHGVVEHLDQEVLATLLSDLARVLVPQGRFVFSFDDLCSDAASRILSDLAGQTPAHRFRLYHPAAIERLADIYGFDAETFSSNERIGFAHLRLRVR